jgi:flagellar P-ring protein FlgI
MGASPRVLEHFPAKWLPLCVAKMRPNKEPEPRSDAIRTGKALVLPAGSPASFAATTDRGFRRRGRTSKLLTLVQLFRRKFARACAANVSANFRPAALVRLAVCFAIGLCLMAGEADAGARIKDITTVRGVRANQLMGYGLIVGLNGTGDSLRNSPFTEQAIQSMLDRMGINVRVAKPRTQNAAGVIVTAELPAFIGPGSRIDVTVSSLGDAKSLFGGTLVLTPLTGPDGKIYAVAQGPVVSSGMAAGGKKEQVTQGVPTMALITNGALVERAAPGNLAEDVAISLELRNPDFNTAVSVADVINQFATGQYGFRVAREQDLRTINLRRPRNMATARFIAEIGELVVEPDAPARVVVDQRSGTIVMGRDVKISTVAIAHGALTVTVTEKTKTVPSILLLEPPAIIPGSKTEETEVKSEQEGGNLAIIKGADLQQLVNGLNKIGAKPPDIIAILQTIKSSGALQADLVIQ